jgi:hypothetical protein
LPIGARAAAARLRVVPVPVDGQVEEAVTLLAAAAAEALR